MSKERHYHFAYLLQVSKISLNSDFIHTFFMVLYMYIASVQGQTMPWSLLFSYHNKPLMTLVNCCKFLPLNDFLAFFDEGLNIFSYKKTVKVNLISSIFFFFFNYY